MRIKCFFYNWNDLLRKSEWKETHISTNETILKQPGVYFKIVSMVIDLVFQKDILSYSDLISEYV